MSKAILVMEMPECCGRCPLVEDDASGMYCIAHVPATAEEVHHNLR